MPRRIAPGQFACFVLAIVLSGWAHGELPSARPNFVFFLVDDLGYGGMGAYGNEYHETPEFDALCQQGMRFTSAYSACTVCSPSRAAIVTGRYPARLHLTDWIAGHKHPKAKLQVPDWKRQIDHSLVTLPEALKQAGYQTWFLGKWHLMPIYDEWSADKTAQEQSAHTPQRHGFDVNVGGCEWGQPKGHGRYFYPFEMPGLEEGHEGEYLTDRLTDEALKLMDDAGDEPFLLYMSYYSVHTPIMGKPELTEYFAEKDGGERGEISKHQRAEYAAMHKSVDQSVGRIMAKLDELGQRENTIVIFTGDNGGDWHQYCGDFRGRKGTAFEGGVREPTCIVWPGVVEPGSVSDVPVIGMDFYPTMLQMAGLDLMPAEHLDGVSLVPVLKGTGEVDRQELFWHYPHYHRTTPYSAIRRDNWRLIEFHEDGELMLFDLQSDPHEEHDLAKSRPQLAAELRDRLNTWRNEVDAQMPTPNPKYEPDRVGS